MSRLDKQTAVLKTIDDWNRALRNCAVKGNLKGVKKCLLIPGIDINSTSLNGNGPLHWAVEGSDSNHEFHHESGQYVDVIQTLLENGVDVNLLNKENYTPYDLVDLFGKGEVAKIFRQHLFSFLNPDFAGFSQFENDSESPEFQEKVLEVREKRNIFSEIEALYKKLSVIFNSYNHLSQISVKAKKDDIVTVLSIGCGYSGETSAVLKYFRNCKVKFIGIDVDKEAITFNENVYSKFSNVSYHCADATNIKNLCKIIHPQSIDLVFLRHPDFDTDESRKIFKEIALKTIPTFLKANSPVFTSFYKKEEAQILFSWLKKSEYYEINSKDGRISDGTYQMRVIPTNEVVVAEAYTQISTLRKNLQLELSDEKTNQQSNVTPPKSFGRG